MTGHIQWPVASDPSHLCGALRRVAVLDSLGCASPLDLVMKESKSWSARFEIECVMKLGLQARVK